MNNRLIKAKPANGWFFTDFARLPATPALGQTQTQIQFAAITQRNVPPVQRGDLENWLWKTHKIRIRGGDPHKLRLSTPYYLQKKDMPKPSNFFATM